MDVAGDHYATLRVAFDADDAAIRRAYRKLIRQHHPDVNACHDAAETSSAINEAYSCLRDPLKRADYNRERQVRHRPSEASSAPPERPPFQPSWGTQYADLVSEVGLTQSKGWRAVSLGLAAIATIVTFTMTSAVDRVEPAPAHLTVLRVDVAEPGRAERVPLKEDFPQARVGVRP